jgi:hypothetical protein
VRSASASAVSVPPCTSPRPIAPLPPAQMQPAPASGRGKVRTPSGSQPSFGVATLHASAPLLLHVGRRPATIGHRYSRYPLPLTSYCSFDPPQCANGSPLRNTAMTRNTITERPLALRAAPAPVARNPAASRLALRTGSRRLRSRFARRRPCNAPPLLLPILQRVWALDRDGGTTAILLRRTEYLCLAISMALCRGARTSGHPLPHRGRALGGGGGEELSPPLRWSSEKALKPPAHPGKGCMRGSCSFSTLQAATLVPTPAGSQEPVPRGIWQAARMEGPYTSKKAPKGFSRTSKHDKQGAQAGRVAS